jgi:hypothetical protein
MAATDLLRLMASEGAVRMQAPPLQLCQIEQDTASMTAEIDCAYRMIEQIGPRQSFAGFG